MHLLSAASAGSLVFIQHNCRSSHRSRMQSSRGTLLSTCKVAGQFTPQTHTLEKWVRSTLLRLASLAMDHMAHGNSKFARLLPVTDVP